MGGGCWYLLPFQCLSSAAPHSHPKQEGIQKENKNKTKQKHPSAAWHSNFLAQPVLAGWGPYPGSHQARCLSPSCQLACCMGADVLPRTVLQVGGGELPLHLGCGGLVLFPRALWPLS